jgi:hypothetical protein
VLNILQSVTLNLETGFCLKKRRFLENIQPLLTIANNKGFEYVSKFLQQQQPSKNTTLPFLEMAKYQAQAGI